MQLTRKEFIGGSAAMMGAAVAGQAAAQGGAPYQAVDYEPNVQGSYIGFRIVCTAELR